MKTITASMLVKAGACHDQLDLFRRTFPRGSRLTLASVQKALSVGLDVDWAIERFATQSARDAYDAATQPAWEAYNAAIESAIDACDAAIAKEALKALLGE